MFQYVVMLVNPIPPNGYTRIIKFMAVKGQQPIWVDKAEANTYSSRYAAKQHLKRLDNVPENVTVVRVEC